MVDNAPNNESQKDWWQAPLMTFLRMSSWVGVPVIVALFFGQFLDKRFNTEPWLFLLTTAIAFGISIAGIVREAGKASSTDDNTNQEHDE